MPLIATVTLAVATLVQNAERPEARYLARFAAALTSFDAGDFAAAEAGFVAAGADAAGAPVWRASAGVAAAHAGRTDDARMHFETALALGYPVSDLAALHALGAEVAAGRADAPHEGASAPRVEWLRQVPGDARHLRDRVVAGEPLGPVTHVVGRHGYEAGRRSPDNRVQISTYRVDFDAGALELLTDREPTRGGGAFGYGLRGQNDPDTALPRPRGPAFLRMLRTGLLVDDGRSVQWASHPRLVALDVTDGRRVVHVRWSASQRNGGTLAIDLARFARSDAEAPPAHGLPAQRMTDAALLERVRAGYHAAHGSGIQVHVLPPARAGDSGALLAAFRGELPKDIAPPPLRILSSDATTVLTEVVLDSDIPHRGFYSWMSVGEPVVAERVGRVLIADARRSAILAFDTSDWRLAWREHVPGGGHVLEVCGALLLTRDEDSGAACEARDARTGEVRFFGAPIGLERLACDESSEVLVGQGHDALYVFGPGSLRPDPLGVEPLWSLWPHGEEPVTVARDGTWALSPAALDAHSRVRIGARLVPARPLAPWLLDPLHVRTFAADADPTPRRVPQG